MTLLLSYYY